MFRYLNTISSVHCIKVVNKHIHTHAHAYIYTHTHPCTHMYTHIHTLVGNYFCSSDDGAHSTIVYSKHHDKGSVWVVRRKTTDVFRINLNIYFVTNQISSILTKICGSKLVFCNPLCSAKLQ